MFILSITMDNNRSRKIVFSIGDELEEIIQSMYHVRSAVYIAYCVKRRYYGAKVLLTVRDRASNSTVIHMVTKLRSEVEIAMFRTLLQGVKDAVYKYVDTGRDSSDE